ncbi:MAG TPA: hypothetical protein VML54_17150 [Candidatus Limnocylindrales bacterium]|nr:hypothetical protein [Candidatus Limnocylindrales bacterium]
MLRKLLIYPPLAFARLGNSRMPLDGFFWGPNDVTPRGTGKTTILPAETLVMHDDGTLSSRVPDTIRFKDETGFRPVCPFFEIHGEWDAGDAGEARGQGPLDPDVLRRFGLDTSRLRWRVDVANLKPYFMTQDWQTRIDAGVVLRGDDVTPRTLRGRSPSGAPEALVPRGTHVPLGVVRLSRPNEAFPGLRLRFIPGRGRFFGPSDLRERWKAKLPRRQLFLNPRSSWCSWRPKSDDPRGNPGGQYAKDEDSHVSLGLVDDTCDGIVSCWIEGIAVPPAYARIVVGPPDYAPDRRPLVSLADGLKDRVARDEVFERGYLDADDHARAEAEREVVDMMERAFETMALMNLDVLNDRVDTLENREAALAQGIPYRDTDHYAFPPAEPMPGDPLPLTERGREQHRRYLVPEVFADFVSKRPDFMARWVRPPLSPDPFFTPRMPALMRGASGHPLHLTRRQYDLLRLWLARLRNPRKTPR